MKTINTLAASQIFATFSVDNINEELTARGCTTTTDPAAGASLLAMGCRSLDEFAATMVNLSQGTIDADTLKAGMVKAFPNHKIGDRHGAHYLSLSRTGSISGNIACRFQPGKATRKAGVKAATYDLSAIDDAQLKAMAKASKGTPLEAIVKSEMDRRATASK